ncbi:MAG: CHAT domain-containing protein [Chitinophagaceae bacterium]|nr:CHAT domain-containing protein [Chitinophagaceae bacterium]
MSGKRTTINRKKVVHLLAATAFCMLLFTAGNAQSLREILMPIVYTDTTKNPMAVVCRSSFAASVKRFQNGEAVAPYEAEGKLDYGRNLGSITVINTKDSFVVMNINRSALGLSRGIRIGDLVKLNVSDTTYHPMHFTGHILALNLKLLTYEKDPFYSEMSLAKRYSERPEDTEEWLLDTLYHDLKSFYEGYKENLTGETFTTPFPKGRYKGRNLVQVFESLTKEDIKAYLWFMISFPGKYIGNPYKFNETFATWLINDSPIGGYEVLKIYEDAKRDSAAFSRKVMSIPGFLSEKGLAYNACLNANSAGYWTETYADELYKGVIWYSRLAKDKHGEGLVYLYRAEAFQNKEMWDEALKNCRLSAAMYSNPPYDDRLLDLYFKQSYIYYTTSRFDSSFVMLQEIKRILNKTDLNIEDYNPDEALGKYHNYMAYTYYKQGRYKDADFHIDSSQGLLAGMEDNKTITSMAYNYNLKGDIYKSQSLFDKSLEAYQKSSDLYKRAGDVKTAATVRIDVGIIMFKQGRYKESNDLLYKIYPLFELENDYNNMGLCLSQIGQNYWNLNLYDSAIASHNKAIGFRRQSGNRSGQAFSWEQLGTLYQKAGLKPNALAALDSAAALYEGLDSKTELAEILLSAGKVYKNDKEKDKAEFYYRKAANTLAAIGNRGSYADALFELGLLLSDDKPELAYQYQDSCRLLCLEAGKLSDAAYAMMNMGNLEKKKGNREKGKQWYDEAKKIVDDLNEPHAAAHFYRSMGSDASIELDFEQGIQYYYKAIQVFDSTDKATALQTRSSVANNLQNLGNYDLAEKVIDSIQVMARESALLLELAEACTQKAWILIGQGQLEKGVPLIDSASKYYTLSGNTNSLAYISDLRGELNRRLFNFAEAYKWYSVSDSIYAKTNNPWLHSARMFNFVVLYFYQGDYQKSLDYTYKAIALRPFYLEDQTYVDLQVALGEIYYYLNKPDSCKWFMDKYMPVARAKKLTSSLNLISLMKGRLLVDEKKYEEAIPFLTGPASEQSFKMNKNVYQQALGYLGLAFSGIGKKDSANKYFDLAVKFANNFELPSFSWEAIYLAGLDAYKNEDYVKSIPLFKQAVALVNKQAANLYGGDEAGKLFRQQPAKADLYFKLMSALTKTGQKDEAWQYATLSQAAAVSDLAGGLGAEMGNEEKQKALKEAQAKFERVQSVGAALQDSKKDGNNKAAQIALLEQKRAIAETEYLNYIKTLKDQFPELNNFFANQVNPEEFRNLHSNLEEDMAMLMYVVNDKELMIFWATQEKTGIVTGNIPEDFYNTIDQWIVALKNPLRPANAGPLVLRTKIGKVPSTAKPTLDVKSGAQQLYNLLFEPVLAEIKDKKSWCIIPNGKLTHIPFHALGTTNSEGKFEYVAATKNIFYTNKPGQMFIAWNRRNKQNFAVFGNPDKSLTSAGVEAKEIAKVYTAAHVYTEDSATVDLAKQSLTGMHYVHFATHGVLAYPDFDSSYLVFAPGPGQPNGGKLSLWEIRQLSIKGCDLVTLSACETAVTYGDAKKGWYISPANAFLLNRVRSVVASLWEVDDNSTGLLMQQFYKHLQSMPKVEALRQAMADVSAKPEYEHPFYWAAFVLYGDWQ